jgi:uncharacterized protein YjbJ (UPF0337 family)
VKETATMEPTTMAPRFGGALETSEQQKAAERARGRLEEFTGALEARAGEMLGDVEMAARGQARENRGRERQRTNR